MLAYLQILRERMDRAIETDMRPMMLFQDGTVHRTTYDVLDVRSPESYRRVDESITYHKRMIEVIEQGETP
jgi:hypothetical protein